ncbi:MAG: hypothetical protein PUJ51_10305 [Clostridiales bacterium]|nr:hypothetical protein [Clostridiales bacterium]
MWVLDDCYKNMFNGCAKLSEVYFGGNNLADDFTWGWLADVAHKGRFTYSYAHLKINHGYSGVPSSWKIV